jgi:hypothetical protein
MTPLTRLTSFSKRSMTLGVTGWWWVSAGETRGWNAPYLSEENLEEGDLAEVGALTADLEVEPGSLSPFVLGRRRLELVFRVVRLLYIFNDCTGLRKSVGCDQFYD